jgi:hypothetical protein
MEHNWAGDTVNVLAVRWGENPGRWDSKIACFPSRAASTVRRTVVKAKLKANVNLFIVKCGNQVGID